MRKVQASEAEHDFGPILKQVERGETVVISREGRDVARVSPENPVFASRQQQKDEMARTFAIFSDIRNRSKRVSPEEVRAWIEEGRK